MATIAKLDVILGMNSTAFDSSLAGVQARLNTFGQSAIRVGTMATMGLTLPLVGFAAVAIKAASDLEESMTKVSVVFGNSAQEIITWSEASAQNMGLSQRAALEYVGTLGNLLQAAGLTQAETVELSTSLVELAADLASFNNVTADEALLALRAALVGEYEPMRRFGVQLTEAEVKARAMALGLYDGEGAISAQAKMLAAYSIIMEQTTTAQGDFVRTSDGMANAQRIARAEFENAAATLGNQLLPITTQAVQALTELIRSFNQLSPEAQKSVMAMAGFAAAIGPVLILVGILATHIVAAGIALTAFGAVLAGLYAPLNAFTGMLMATLSPISLVIQAIKENAQALMDFGASLNAAVAIISAAMSTVVLTIGDAKDVALAHFSALMTGAITYVAVMWNSIKGQFEAIKANIVDSVTAAKDDALAAFESLKTGAIVKLTNLWTSVTSQMAAIKSVITSNLTEAKTAAIAAITSMTQGMGAQLAGFASTAAALAWSIGAAIANGIKSGIAALAGEAISAAQSLVDSVMSILSNIPGFSPIEHATAFYGAKAAQGFADGIASLERRVANSSQNVVDAAMRPFDVQSSGEFGASSGSGGVHHHHYYSVTPNDLRLLIENANAGGQFAKGFGHELGLYAGQP